MAAKMPFEVTHTPTGRASFLYCFEPMQPPKDAKGELSGKPKYKVSLLIPKGDSAKLDPIRKLVREVATKAFGGKDKDGKPIDIDAVMRHPKFNQPVHDGDVEKPELAEYAGHFFLNCNSAQKPGVVDQTGKRQITDPNEVFSGCFIRCKVSVSAFAHTGNRGVTFYLNSIQLVRPGPRLGLERDATKDFEAVPEEEQALPPADDAENLAG
jgi:hypothetical protein